MKSPGEWGSIEKPLIDGGNVTEVMDFAEQKQIFGVKYTRAGERREEILREIAKRKQVYIQLNSGEVVGPAGVSWKKHSALQKVDMELLLCPPMPRLK